MVKEIILGATGVFVVTAIIAVVKYLKSINEKGDEVERIYVDELNLGVIKEWFVERLTNEVQKGVVFYPTKENTEQWKIKIPEDQNQLIQMVYDIKTDKVIAYREIAFAELSDKLKTLLDSNNGVLVIDK